MTSQEIFVCQACGSNNLYKFVNFGQMPRPNVYLTKPEVGEQTTYQLGADVCTNCGLVQLDRIVPSEELFTANYAYRTPEVMRRNFTENVIETIDTAFLQGGGKVLEVGGGIGIVLQEYQHRGMQVLGVDPAIECAKEANRNGVETIAKPFTLQLAKDIVKTRGKMDIVTAANVFQHIPDIKGTFAGVAEVLSEHGIFVLEFPYLGDILKDLAWDTFYAEHYYYLGLLPLQKLLNSLRLQIFHAKPLPNIHCGSMRIFVKHKPCEITPALYKLLSAEQSAGFSDPKTYQQFGKRIDQNMHQLQEHLYIAKMRGDRIVGHGASAKFVTLTNYGHIGRDLIEYVADNTSAKQGLFTPGMGIPVVSEEKLIADAPDLVVCGIRNFYEQSKPLYEKLKTRNPKCKILIPIPEVTYL